MKKRTSPVTLLFICYFVANSLIFLGQDLSVNRQESGSWRVTLAEHSPLDRGRAEDPSSAFSHSGQSCGHRHEGNEVHLCLDHHRFLLSGRIAGLPIDSGPQSVLPAFPSLHDIPDYEPPDRGISRNHDPGPAFPGLTASTILLL